VFVGGALQFRDPPAGGQQCESDKFGFPLAQSQELILIQLTAHNPPHDRVGLTRVRRPWLHARLHSSAQGIAQIAYFNILSRAELQTAEELP
jgi:hypothetical protein